MDVDVASRQVEDVLPIETKEERIKRLRNESSRRWYAKNAAYHKEYFEKNKDKLVAYRKEYMKAYHIEQKRLVKLAKDLEKNLPIV